MISYSGLLQKLNEKGLTKTALTKELGISSRTVAKIGRGEKIADHVLKSGRNKMMNSVIMNYIK